MNVACPECATIYRLDPDRVPEGGVATRCRECGTGFRVPGHGNAAPGAVVAGARIPARSASPAGGSAGEPAGSGERPGPGGPEPGRAAEDAPGGGSAPPVFGPQDPQTRARRLARALVSDIKVYHRERWQRSRDAGTVRTDFRDEILKSWEEYVEQVGEGMAKKTPYFRDALNDILAEGDRVF